MTVSLSKDRMEALLRDLNDEMARMERTGEISIVGGAVMCLVDEARATTRDVDAFCHPASGLRHP